MPRVSLKSIGGNVVFFGKIFDESREYAEKIASEKVALIITGGNLSIPRLKNILGVRLIQV